VRIRRLTVRREGVSGFLFSPAGHSSRPAVLAFGGSEGGDGMIDTAGLLAAHGYPALALAYFKAAGLPSHLVRIPLEYFARAARILRRDPAADATHVVTMGTSYGGEASLLVASSFPGLIHGAIALVPSARVTSGVPELGGSAAAWTLRGKAVPERTIAVERISGPILAEGAGSDGEWDSAGAVSQIDQRLRARHFRFGHSSVVYPRAGHFSGIVMPYMPEPVDDPAPGGTPRADASAQADLWRRILSYLNRLDSGG
jgi:dienelactone hydrolase